jgi:hypothetical protein
MFIQAANLADRCRRLSLPKVTALSTWTDPPVQSTEGAEWAFTHAMQAFQHEM